MHAELAAPPARGTGIAATVTSASRCEVRADHLADVHLVDVVAAEDADVLGRLVGDDVLALVHGVGRAPEPALAGALLRGDRLDELSSIGESRHARAMCSSSEALLYCVRTLIRVSPELTKFERTMSMMR